LYPVIVAAIVLLVACVHVDPDSVQPEAQL
jgi:hypothetical protein